jgi:hypothetical protein
VQSAGRRLRTDPRLGEMAPTLDRWVPLLLQGAQKLPSGLLAASAGLLADPAMFMVAAMTLALVAAALADGHARL